jgi:hypothetical protein
MLITSEKASGSAVPLDARLLPFHSMKLLPPPAGQAESTNIAGCQFKVK